MAQQKNSIRIHKAALDESPTKTGDIVLRGVIDKTHLRFLLIDDYQREALPLSSLAGLIEAVKRGDTLPDIEIGMRGDACSGRGDDYVLNDRCYIIDGQQRRNACMQALMQNPDLDVRLGCMVHFATDAAWERERFRILNSLRSKVSPNVLLRNARETSPAAGALYGLSFQDKSFALHNKVSWSQRLIRSDLLTALMLFKVNGRLHAHKATGGRSTAVQELVRGADTVGEVVGIGNMRENLKTFFNALDACWSIRLIQYREMASCMRGTFLTSLALMFSDHHDFWKGDDEKRLFIDTDQRNKLALFPISDPSVAGLASAGGRAGVMLYNLLVEHMNRGKKVHRLHRRALRNVPLDDEESTLEEAA